ncbi:PEP/pyruvate-binding domain-containing protein [Aureispira anguillae]|uniref:Pyruvate, water dikinase n=1 Tax=Aureispira anguillae TaxID=2864201 RepID=A0A916DR94_9BACT|nr:PEP/pyruvate-binding domain-containing protein [Aureispira anguillae]BDS11151.1 hypothetical protein AsAng_0018620 [Aureispira anguillae]
MRFIPLLFFVVISTLNLSAQQWYAKPDFAVRYISYFGIGSESVQKPSVLGNNAAMYALMQQQFPQLTGQGIGVPVFFYQETLKNCGADLLIKELLEHYNNLKPEEISKQLKAIRAKILAAKISSNLIHQLKNATQEFFSGKRIRISTSPNYQALTINAYKGIKPTYTLVTNIDELSLSITKAYASFWEDDNVQERFTHKGDLNQKELALGLLVTEAFEYGYAIGKVSTDYTTTHPSIHILSKRESSTERIGFIQFDSKWYRTYEEGKEHNIFVDNAALTPTVRQLQHITTQLDPLLRSMMPKSDKFKNKEYTAVFTFILQKENKGFRLRLLQPELQLLWAK